MLHEFLTTNRKELISRCRAKVAKRFEPVEMPAAIDHGVPLFLQQLVETLRMEELTDARESAEPVATPAATDVGRAAALHGAELLRLGFTVDQVVHEYGDVCQAVTAMAIEQEAPLTTDEFRTLNRCLDNAIADAVKSFGSSRQILMNGQAETLHNHVRFFSAEHRRLVDIAKQSFTAIKTGSVGLTGATGALLSHTLDELHSLAERRLPEIRLAAATTTVSPY